ncbi:MULTISPECIES: hypothetical protein [unclassified Streptomyces]|uniref:hypothetical protein n=1 Tax=unclassified Streptomyces TaxID=2593676 RepID=UPI0006AEBF69|nr:MULTISPECIES: hypothetical protein [unclassified Streptomyces]KOX16172.1 hypothetical protein ADL06_33905 [Streptomyces sp. NRRL F-6491]KOX35893.1 hypothetical protein ADL08_33925 [Streptomyces sp. NRRL F-6492]
MPRNEGPRHEDPPHDGFEEELGAVLRRTGEGFAADDRRELVEGGLRRGRRRLARRRLAVTGSALALAALGVGGVYGGLLSGPAGPAGTASVAAPPKPTSATDPADPQPGAARIPVKDIAAVLKAHTPAGQWKFDDESGLGQGALGVYDDGGGEAAVSVLLSRSHGPGEAGEGLVTCPDEAHVPDVECTTETLPGGGRLMLLQGYEYPDRREETKNWRATLLTEDGFLVDVNEYNAAAEKGAPVSRENPPFTLGRLKSLVTADAWRPLLAKLTQPSRPSAPPSVPDEPSGDAVRTTLRSLLPEGLKVEGGGGQDDYGYAGLLVDDGKGRSFVEINVQTGMQDVAGHLHAIGAATLPDGRLVGVTQEAAEKGGDRVVARTVDTLTPEGFRVVITTLNSDGYRAPATRAEPALTVEQLKAIALSPKWRKPAE